MDKTDPRDTTEMLHDILAKLDRGEGPNADLAHIGTTVRDLVTVVDSLDQRLKRVEERPR